MGFVQVASNTSSVSDTSLTVTLGSPTTAGNCLIVCWGGNESTTNPTVSGVTLGGVSTGWSAANTAYNNADQNAAQWILPNCAGGQTSVVISSTGGSGGSSIGLCAFVFEWSGVVTVSPLDQHPTGQNGSSASPSSGATGTLSQPNEVAFGVIAANGTLTGPGAPWTSETSLLVSGVMELTAGYQQVSSTSALTYTGTLSSANIFGACIITLKLSSGVAQAPAPSPVPVPPGLQSPMSLTVPARYSIPPPPQLQPAPSPQQIPPGLQSPMSLGVPSRPATSAPPAPPAAAVAVPPPLLKPPGLQSPMSLTVPSRPATGQPPAPPPPPAPGSWQPHPPGRMSPMSLGLPMVQPPQAPSTPGPPGPVPPIPSGVVFGVQGSSGGDRDPEVRMFRTIMPGEVPVSGSALPKLHGRGYAAPPPERAEDVAHLWEEPAEPAPPPGPGPAEIALREAQRAGDALYQFGRIIAPEPYVPPSKARCGALRKIGTETLRCSKKRGHPGMHSDRGVRWG